MPPHNDEMILKHQLSSALTFDATSDDESPASSSLEGSHDARVGRFVRPIDNSNDDADDDEFVDQQLFFVTSYSDFDKLAHGPRGHGAKHTLRVYKFVHDGSLVLWHIAGDSSRVINPAFSRFHPR